MTYHIENRYLRRTPSLFHSLLAILENFRKLFFVGSFGHMSFLISPGTMVVSCFKTIKYRIFRQERPRSSYSDPFFRASRRFFGIHPAFFLTRPSSLCRMRNMVPNVVPSFLARSFKVICLSDSMAAETESITDAVIALFLVPNPLLSAVSCPRRKYNLQKSIPKMIKVSASFKLSAKEMDQIVSLFLCCIPNP
jgi:hypothetical protein